MDASPTHGRLVLTRATGESIFIGSHIELHITRLAADYVMLAVYDSDQLLHGAATLRGVYERGRLEKLEMGQDIRCFVERIGGRFVQLAIEAPRRIHIRRAELLPEDQLICGE